MNDENKFFTVYAYRVYNEYWTIEGIYSKEEDAKAHQSELEANELVFESSTNVQLLPMGAIIEGLVRDRLGAMAEAIMGKS